MMVCCCISPIYGRLYAPILTFSDPANWSQAEGTIWLVLSGIGTGWICSWSFLLGAWAQYWDKGRTSDNLVLHMHMHMYMCTYTYIYIYICIRICMHIYIYIYLVYVCMYIDMQHEYIYIYMVYDMRYMIYDICAYICCPSIYLLMCISTYRVTCCICMCSVEICPHICIYDICLIVCFHHLYKSVRVYGT